MNIGVVFINDSFGETSGRIAHSANVGHIQQVSVLLYFVSLHTDRPDTLPTKFASRVGVNTLHMCGQGVGMLECHFTLITFYRIRPMHSLEIQIQVKFLSCESQNFN